MKVFRLAVLQSLCLIALSTMTSCKGKGVNASAGSCGYEISIVEGGNAIVSYKGDCQNNGIAQRSDEWLMVLSSDDLKYSLTISVIGVSQGAHTIKNEPPYGKGTANLLLTSDRSLIPGALSFSSGTFTITKKDKTGDANFTATATSALNKKTYTVTGTIKNMPIRTN